MLLVASQPLTNPLPMKSVSVHPFLWMYFFVKYLLLQLGQMYRHIFKRN